MVGYAAGASATTRILINAISYQFVSCSVCFVATDQLARDNAYQTQVIVTVFSKARNRQTAKRDDQRPYVPPLLAQALIDTLADHPGY